MLQKVGIHAKGNGNTGAKSAASADWRRGVNTKGKNGKCKVGGWRRLAAYRTQDERERRTANRQEMNAQTVVVTKCGGCFLMKFKYGICVEWFVNSAAQGGGSFS